jgi:hypothetical protein
LTPQDWNFLACFIREVSNEEVACHRDALLSAEATRDFHPGGRAIGKCLRPARRRARSIVAMAAVDEVRRPLHFMRAPTFPASSRLDLQH